MMNIIGMRMNNIQTGCFSVETRHDTSLQHRLFVLALFFAFPFLLPAQDDVTLRFTGQDQNGRHVQLSSILVENVTQRWQEELLYPDTTLIMGTTGIEEVGWNGNGVRLFQNTPNPFDGVTDFALYLPEASKVLLEICDLNGIVTATYRGSLDPGSHLFRAWLASPQTYLLQARTSDGTVQIKMVNTGSAGQSRMAYIGTANTLVTENAGKGSTNQPFSQGDLMLYKGYAHMAGTQFECAPVERQQYNSELIPLTFTLPLPTVTTVAATDITPTQGRLNGSVTEHPDYTVMGRGLLFADNSQFNGAVEYSTGSGSGQFHYMVSNLQPATRYYYRAYAHSAMGTTYGDVLFFDTQAEMPTVFTLEVMDVSASMATVTGNVTAAGGASITARGVCWSTAQNPTLNDSHTDDGNGLGIFTSHITGLTPDTTYYVRAYATNSAGTAFGEQRSFTTRPPFYCGIDTVTDYDGNVYQTVEIGQQCWLKENLRTTHYADGTEIPVGTGLSENIAYRYYPNNSSSNVPNYGYMYNWTATMHGESSSNANPSGVQGICPPGWHVPSKAEFEQLINFVSSQSQYVCDNNNIARALAAPLGWLCWSDDDYICYPAYYTWLSNATGYSALPAGQWSGSANDFGRVCTFWSSTSDVINGNLSAFPFVVGDGVDINGSHLKAYAHSVRCLLDDSGMTGDNAIIPTVTTKTILDLSSSSASCGGLVYGSGGADVTTRGICWDTLPNPTVNDSHTSDGTGTGGYTCSMTDLMPSTTYYVRAYATNSVGTAYGEQRSFTTWDSLICDSTLTDYDGNIYHTVVIGQQCWMRENLRTTHFPDGTAIPVVTTVYYIPYRAIPNNDSTLIPEYGYLYNGYAAMNGFTSSNTGSNVVQGICPNGWHVPSITEWEQLVHFLESRVEYRCGCDTNYIAQSLAATSGWEQNIFPCAVGFDINANNASGFSALPAGAYDQTYGAHGIHKYTEFWHSTSNGNQTYLSRTCLGSSYLFISFVQTFSPSQHDYQRGISVRCLRD